MNPSPSNRLVRLEETVSEIRKHTSAKPKVGLILGSGLGALADRVEGSTEIPYSDLPGFHAPSVAGHAGRLVLGRLAGVEVAILKGRFHRYEGHTMDEVAFPTRVLSRLGIHSIILTNASGAVNTRFRPRDIMVIEDHLNLSGDNPHFGKHVPEFGERFPDMTAAYDPIYREQVLALAQKLGISIHSGVYACVPGPTYETPAEIRMLRTMGADAVGMSTVGETLAAHAMGVRVLGLCCITNLAAGLSPGDLTHDEVMENSNLAAAAMEKLILGVLPKLGGAKP